MVGPKYENSKGAFQNWVIPGFPSIYTIFFGNGQAGKSTIRQMHDRTSIQAMRKMFVYTEEKIINICSRGTGQRSKLDR